MAGHSPDSDPRARGATTWHGHPAHASQALPATAEISESDLIPPTALTWLKSHAAAAVAQAKRPGEVRVRLVADPEMAAAHQRFSKIDGTTDVLTFDLSEGRTARDASAPLDVDILACVDEARRQAAAHNHPAEHELLLYILHGVLHCLGHDDHDEQAFELMHAEEDRILKAIGVGPVFARGGHT